MAIAQQKSGSGRKFVYFSLASGTTKHLSEEDAKKGRAYAGFLYQEAKGAPHKLARALVGNIVNVRLGEDEYDGQKFPIATIRLVDDDDTDEIVKFRLDQSLGRGLIGLVASSELDHGGGPVEIYVSQSFKGDKWANGTVAEKDATYISMKPAGAKNEEKYRPVYVDDKGEIVSFKNDKGEDSPLPMATKIMNNGKPVLQNGRPIYDFTAQTELAVNNARALEAHFKDKENQAHSQAPAHDGSGDDMIDPNEAVAASAPRA